tara:strand:+ start:285 stop:1391 length:1107 start_codon:yes stop_codon:yes gene_type:complete
MNCQNTTTHNNNPDSSTAYHGWEVCYTYNQSNQLTGIGVGWQGKFSFALLGPTSGPQVFGPTGTLNAFYGWVVSQIGPISVGDSFVFDMSDFNTAMCSSPWGSNVDRICFKYLGFVSTTSGILWNGTTAIANNPGCCVPETPLPTEPCRICCRNEIGDTIMPAAPPCVCPAGYWQISCNPDNLQGKNINTNETIVGEYTEEDPSEAENSFQEYLKTVDISRNRDGVPIHSLPKDEYGRLLAPDYPVYTAGRVPQHGSPIKMLPTRTQTNTVDKKHITPTNGWDSDSSMVPYYVCAYAPWPIGTGAGCYEGVNGVYTNTNAASPNFGNTYPLPCTPWHQGGNCYGFLWASQIPVQYPGEQACNDNCLYS